jgi:hypothetical protein
MPIVPTFARRYRRIVALLAVAIVAVVTVSHAPPASAAAGDAYWFMLNDAGNVGPYDVYAQALRADGQFSGQLNISWQTGQVVGNSHSISAVRLGGRLHVFAATATVASPTGPRNGDLLYAMQNSDGTWPDWTRIYRRPGAIAHVVAANVAGQLHVVITGPWNGNRATILHSVKQSNGQWSTFSDLTTFAGNPGARNSYQLAVAGTPSGLLHVLVDGPLAQGKEKINHTVRWPDGSWSTWGSIVGDTGRPWSSDNPAWGPNKLTAAAVGDDVHLLFENNGVVYHTIRHTDGNWLPFGNMSAATGLNRYDFAKLSATGFASNGNLLVAGVHSPANDLRYTIRRPNGSWDWWTSNQDKPSDNVSDISDMFVTGE